jgi:hypothetical protein
MFPSLPYDYPDLNEDAEDDRLKSVFWNALSFIRLAGGECSSGRDEEYLECEDEWRSCICFGVAFQSGRILLPSLLSVGVQLSDKTSLPLNPLVIRVQS